MSSDPNTSPVHPEVERRVDSADSTLQNPQQAVVAFGSNLGNRLETIQGALDALEDTPGVRVRSVSPVYETAPVGGPEGQPSYFNAIALVNTTLQPAALLERVNAVEDAFGRARQERWSSRTLDVDIISYASKTSDDPRLTLPHPRAGERAFVLAPWHDADQEAELPGQGHVTDLLAAADRSGVARRDDITLVLPR